MATPHSPRRCFCQRRRSYKQMVQDVAENLGSEDVQKIVFHHDLPAEFNGKTALTALRQLEMQGQFSESDTEHLESLLKGIHRYDLINKHVVHYRRNYCGCEDSYGARGTSSSAPIPIPLGTAPTSPTITPSLRPPTHITSSIPDKSKQSLSTRLQTEEKREIQDLLKRYVPHEVIRRSPIWKKFPFHSQNLSSRSTESLNGSSAFKDGPTSSPSSKCLSTSMSRSRKATEMHRYSFPCLPPRVHRRATCPLPEELDRENDLEWVVLDTSSVTDSGTCSGSSLDSSLDIEIGNLSKQTHDKQEQKVASNGKKRRYFMWRIKRSEFMIPLFQHTSKTFEKKIKLCMGPRGPCLSVVFKLFPNGVGSDENIYSSFRIELPSATQIVPPGTSLVFSITVRDLHTADVLASRHMEVVAETEEYMMEQFLAHEVIKSSQARHFEISIMTKVNASSNGWVEIQSQH